MTDIQRALLGDHAAAERLTERGELIPCPFCGGNAVAAGCGVYRHIRCSGCYCDGPQEEGIEAARLSWNTRAPILSAEEMEMLEKMVKEYQETIIPGFREQAEKAENERDSARATLREIIAYREREE